MSRFCEDLSIVGMSTEFDGCPETLDSGARTLRTTSQKLNEAASSIRKLTECGNEMESQAYGALAERSREVHDSMNKVAMRYRMMATAVSTFADVLRTEQGNARRILVDAREAKAARDRARSRYCLIQEMARTADPCTLDEARRQATETRNAYVQADTCLGNARQAIRAAAQRIKEANHKASCTIRTAMEVSGLNDSFWDKLADLGSKIWKGICAVAKFIWKHIDKICLALDIIATVIAFIPGVGTLAGLGMKLFLGLGRMALKGAKALSALRKGSRVLSGICKAAGRGAASAVVKIGAGIQKAFKFGKKISKGIDTFAERFAKKAFSINGGVIQQTRFGRMIHNLGERFGGPTFRKGTPLPPDFLTQHINRTTEAIQRGTSKAIKKIGGGLLLYGLGRMLTGGESLHRPYVVTPPLTPDSPCFYNPAVQPIAGGVSQ